MGSALLNSIPFHAMRLVPPQPHLNPLGISKTFQTLARILPGKMAWIIAVGHRDLSPAGV
jgi:hypothetical protein